jgi:hypothetical protein
LACAAAAARLRGLDFRKRILQSRIAKQRLFGVIRRYRPEVVVVFSSRLCSRQLDLVCSQG